MTETTKAPSKQALEAARSIFERVRSCSTYEGWVCDDETETEAIAAALDDFAEAQSEGLLKARERAIAERDALRERNRALVEALAAITIRAPDADGLLWLGIELPDQRGHAGFALKYPAVAKPPSIVQQVIEAWVQLRSAALAADAKAGDVEGRRNG